MNNKINKEEKDILESFEKGEWISSPNFDERKKQLKNLAGETIRKHKRINI